MCVFIILITVLYFLWGLNVDFFFTAITFFPVIMDNVTNFTTSLYVCELSLLVIVLMIFTICLVCLLFIVPHRFSDL